MQYQIMALETWQRRNGAYPKGQLHIWNHYDRRENTLFVGAWIVIY